jgi:hypothetical protein
MKHEVATRRFLRALIPAMAVFLIASLLLAWLKSNGASPAVLVATAAVPIAALLVPFWAMWRFLTDVDEFLRFVQVKALLVGTATALTIASGWGYLEAYAGTPALPVLWLNPIFWLGYAVAACVLTFREGYSL